ncbi:hypothetical protein I6A84_06530 [Frankia sp. CNm7]|uniref:Uncharacterized protein n=1 Tax=Frankia nepalensis TaxID=1836974 RepID=A0A937RCF5_9ACTN|nr:hypothetical protein [Frankia nepalensis]MBL7500347.1 hypothetical protein [Frankia nepalensis]MBL7508569.1 hypothetical protein [Frankia nepalensis]MBL7517789.1 hypothetical protein [Frankia nepalensis]MBL7627697.1 hypothetical protein [Frankia nepalensis]
MTPNRLTKAFAAVTLVGALGVTAAACSSSGDNDAACSSIEQSIEDLNTTTASQVSDPTAMGKTYHEQAEAIRASANGASGDVKTAGLKVAQAVDDLGTFVEGLANSTSTTPQMPDNTALISAGTELQNACN